ncbi:MAG: RHS repeat-associated core domain-containing protein [Burkholderiales bacterium]
MNFGSNFPSKASADVVKVSRESAAMPFTAPTRSVPQFTIVSIAKRLLALLVIVVASWLGGITNPAYALSATPSFRSSSTLNGTGSIAFPAGSLTDDWLIMTAVSTSPVATPVGWTLLRGYRWNSYTHYSYLFARKKGTDTSVSLSLVNGGAVIAAYQNTSGIGGVTQVAQSGATANTLVLDGLTPRANNSLIVGLATDRDVVVPTGPGTYTQRVAYTTTYFGISIADRAFGSTASTGTQTLTQATTYAAIGAQIELLALDAAPVPPVPQFRSSSSVPMILGTGMLAFPAGSVASDWLVMNATSNDPIQTPPGWTLNQSRYWLAWGSWQYSNVYTRQRGAETSVTIGLKYGGAVILAFQGVGGNGSVGSFALSTQTAATLDVGGITPQHANSLVLGIINDRDVSTPVSYAEGYTNFVNYNMTYFGTNFTGKAFGNTSATGTQTWSQAATAEAVGMLMELRPIVAPTTTASFSPDTVAAGGVSSLTFTVNHANAYPLSNATFSVTLPANVSIASGQISGTCVGTTTTPALTVGATNVSFSVPSLPSAGCTVVTQVSSGAVGSFNVASSGVTTAQTPVAGAAGTGATLTATTTVLPPVISLGFSPEWIASGGTSTVTYTVSSQSGFALQNAAFSHTLNNLTVANTTIGGTCSGVTATPALWVGATSVSLNIATLPSSGCTVTIGVSSTVLGYHANATSAVTASGVSGSGSPSQTDFLTVVQSAAGIFYVHTDHLGTPRAITDPSDNKLVWRWKNDDPFGNNQPDENPNGANGSGSNAAFKYNLRFPGQYFDQETGTYYNYFRDYEPSVGRYIQSDPIGLRGGINTYAYVSGNPLGSIDPLGLAAALARCASQILGNRVVSFDETDKIFLMAIRVPGLEPTWRPSIGPNIDPMDARRIPIKPDFEMTLILYDIEFWRYETYRVTQLFQKLLNWCERDETDACGKTKTITTFSNSEIKLSSDRTLTKREQKVLKNVIWRSPAFGL